MIRQTTPSDSTAPAAPEPQAGLLPSVPLLALDRQHTPLREQIRTAIDRVVDSGRFVLGPDVTELEAELARALGVPHVISCASGSDALLLALMALGVDAGDEVIVPSYTFFATASAVTRLGARRAGVPVVEDAAQSILSTWHGSCSGAIGDVGCFSFYPTKNLGGIGDGGFLTTTRDDVAKTLKLLRVHGMEPRYYHQLIGINSRLDSIQAAVLRVKLPHLDAWSSARQVNAARYGELFAAAGLTGHVTVPGEESRGRHVWNQYVVRVATGRRDELRTHLSGHGVGTEIYYPVPLHMQKCFEHLGWRTGDLPHTEQAAAETLALPIFPELTEAEQRTVVARIAEYFDTAQAPATKPAAEAIRGPHFLRRAVGKADEVRS
jgi:dTDP-4-amino-4,6-dideoxygalactose transaminase